MAANNGLQGGKPEVKKALFDASYLVLGLGDVYLGAPCAVPVDPRHRLVTTKYNPARTFTAGTLACYISLYTYTFTSYYYCRGHRILCQQRRRRYFWLNVAATPLDAPQLRRRPTRPINQPTNQATNQTSPTQPGLAHLTKPHPCPTYIRNNKKPRNEQNLVVHTPEGTVGIGGSYMCIYPMNSPGGYQLVGRTLPIWNTFARAGPFTPTKPWLLEFFDQVRTR